MKTTCLVLTFTALAASSTQAATPVPAPQAPMVDRWDAGVVTATLIALHATDIHDASIDGQPGLLARTADGLSMGVYAVACAPSPTPEPPICRGVEGLISYDPAETGDHALLVDRLNHDFATGKFMVERDGTVRLTRYINLRGGISQANLKADLADFLAVSTNAKQTVWATPAR